LQLVNAGNDSNREPLRPNGSTQEGHAKTSDALTLDGGVFARNDPRSIARSLKRSAERSRRRKSGSYASAMSMLTFYINRAGRKLPASRKRKLMAAKQELRSLYGKD
jgi:hypothetical protein